MSNTSQKEQTIDLLNFQQDGLDYLYHLEPTQNNLFWVGHFAEAGTGENGNDWKSRKHALPNSQFRVQSLNFESTSFELENLKQMHQNFISSISVPEEVSISWIDDFARSVQQYHLRWMNCWYDREHDCMISGHAIEKMRSCEVVLFHYKDGTSGGASSSIYTSPIAEKIATVYLRGLIPKSSGNFNFTMGSSGADSTLNITYGVTEIQVVFENNFDYFSDESFKEHEVSEKSTISSDWNSFYI